MAGYYSSIFIALALAVTTTTAQQQVPDTSLPTGVTPENPLRVFLQAGQSDCAGSAKADMLNADDNPDYDDLKGEQDGVWLASIKGSYQSADESKFFLAPMVAGLASGNGATFGPEGSLGQRISEAISAPVLIVKYCYGGTGVKVNWNPTTEKNSWDRTQDDGTAEWLSNEMDLTSRDHLYINSIYTMRRALEALDDGEIPYTLSGLFWVQGASDRRDPWKTYGTNLLNVVEAFRADLGEPDLPVVDMTDVQAHSLQTGKAYAASVVAGCNMVQATWSLAVEIPDGNCNPCFDGTYLNFDALNYYGYDPNMNTDEYSDWKPDGASDKTFHWFKVWPGNQHKEYEGKILQGRTLANTYVKNFALDSVASEKWALWLEEDINEKFPFLPCDPSVNDGKPSADNLCWMDLREESDLAEATCVAPAPTDTPVLEPTAAPTANPTASPTKSPTATPTSMPTTESPIATPTSSPTLIGCVDDPDFRFRGRARQSCVWLSKRKWSDEKKQKKCNKRASEDKNDKRKTWEFCKETCFGFGITKAAQCTDAE